MLPLCVVLPARHPLPLPWAPELTNSTIRVSTSPFPYHFFDWSLAADCEWALFIRERTFVDFEALQRRLACVGHEQPRVLGRLADRHDRRYPVVYGLPLPVPKLRAGIVVSAGALQGYAAAVANACAPPEISMLRTFTMSHESWQGNADETFDFSAALCFFHARVPRAEPLGHEEEHFVLGPAAGERLAVRRAVSRAGHFRYGARACVLSAFPVDLPEQRWLARQPRGRCSAAWAEHISMASIYMGTLDMNPAEGDKDMHELDGYGVSDVSRRIVACGEQLMPYQDVVPLPGPTPKMQNRTRLAVLVGLPGGGTTWFYDALVAGHGPRLAHHTGFFHPYCHQLWRVELSQFVAATEDLSRIHLFRERVPPLLFDDLTQRMLRQHLTSAVRERPYAERPTSFLTRENLNVWRVPDYVRNGFFPIALLRHRRHTFPLSDAVGSPTWAELVDNMHGANDVKYSTLCRTCFYFCMFHAPQIGALNEVISDEPILMLSRQAMAAPQSPLAKQVAAHTLFWYVILRLSQLGQYSQPIVSYQDLVLLEAEALRERLRELLPPWLDAGAVAGFALASRRDAAWLRRREARYEATEGHAEAEAVARDLILTIRAADPSTNVDLLA